MRKSPLIVALIALGATAAYGQTSPAKLSASESNAPAKISDNSFLVEEAYNQEAGVVQHIANVRSFPYGSFLFTFTQEWPAPGQRHQVSYSVPVIRGSGAGTGIGDLVLNYRYQLLGKDEEKVWMSPRVSAILPTGSVADGRGPGGPGEQVNLPLSIEISDALVTHWNAGATLTRAHALNGVRQNTRDLNAAASAIWLLSPTFNLMLEAAWERDESLDDVGVRSAEGRFVILPGVRAAINMPSGMQIVPGFGVPINVGTAGGQRDLFFYLSVEHTLN
jgi:hypothetical protein